MDELPRVLAGRYEVGELIGRGGMAEVHIGRDNRLSRRVAIKVLRSDLARDPTFQARFRREAQSAAALNHPAIVSVYDTGEDIVMSPTGVETHLPFIVMEYVEGHTVRDLLRDGAALPIDEAVDIVSGVLSALEYSHHAGIVHRDIKPANVMITPTGDVKVMDFGIARAMADSAATMTQTQAVVGTAQYLSPEQARGEVVDARSDVYSTGALLFELLTGRPPFIGDSPVSVAYQHVREEAPTPSSIAPDVPEELDRIVLTALAKDRDVRYQSAAEFRSDLEAARAGGVVGAPSVGAIRAANAGPATEATQVLGAPAAAAATAAVLADDGAGEDEGGGPRKWWIWVLAILGVLLIGAIIWALLNRGDDPGGNETPTPTQVAVPNVEGMTQDDAREALEALELEPDFSRTEASDTIEQDLAIRSDPAAETQVDPGTTVYVYISAGPDTITVPEVRNQTQQQARDTLIEAGFDAANISTAPVDDADLAQNQAAGTDPAAGQEVAPNATIVLQIATGNVAVPDLTGLTEAEAQQLLQDNNLVFARVEQPTGDIDPGIVVDWTPNTIVPRFSTITVSIAIAPPEPTPTPTETPSATEGPTEPPDEEP
ncbi:serine/threonine protein kinase with PASTA sensor(s) [Beutenbergia cavernae DSM 12333]|uniref:non-specific serine/threonine protein kinase n=1 Tax=Beutenbergia cavernae (strain ATCC BAA-8 / DSM 12333 / CCUG 43141 / JCM 11478 / NBRC 16432 / NCIMB 13614 / HKI 0122) TaxID=471853 RepID=C5BUR8_BEUC1|nr:Stk1 family PASTA domain-containing Ser/Thr kinase [Beutenbergia cavernae]ACQ78292.1 serine/threonine protein kinase with PASTA sensor(s) [Beutenbergia cavernae DSM 12333]